MRVKSKQRPGHTWDGIPVVDSCYLGNDTWLLVLMPANEEEHANGKSAA